MKVLEFSCIAIITFYILFQIFTNPQRKRYLIQYVWLALTSWLAETTVIRAYHFYSYSPEWSLFVDHVPLLIFLIWPVVIHSAWRLISYLEMEQLWKMVFVTAGVVLSDASLIEPVCVSIGLWEWYAPGLFKVPPIGILGWAYFAGLCVFCLEKPDSLLNSIKTMLLSTVLCVALTHLLLLLSWWSFFRWMSFVIPSEVAIVVIWLVSCVILVLVLKKKPYQLIPKIEFLLRIPGASFFYILILYYGPQWPLFFYALAFFPPYLFLTLKAPFKKEIVTTA